MSRFFDSDGNRIMIESQTQFSDIKQGNKINAMFDDKDIDSDDENVVMECDKYLYNEYVSVICSLCFTVQDSSDSANPDYGRDSTNSNSTNYDWTMFINSDSTNDDDSSSD
eukprot:65860_1